MSDKFYGVVRTGATSVSIMVFMGAANQNTGVTGLAFGAVTAYYCRQGGTPQVITLSALGSVAAAWQSGGWFEVDSIHMPGLYRLDLPDACSAAGSDFFYLELNAATCRPYTEEFNLSTSALITGDVYALLNTAVETIGAGSLGTLKYTGIMRLIVALIMGLANGGGTGLVNLRDQANAKNRVSYTVDENGNRTQMVVDLT